MAESKKPEDGGGTIGRLAGRGEEAVTRLVEELGKNPRVSEVIDRALASKVKVEQSARGALAQAGVAAADELKELRKQIERLERRLAKLETTSGTGTAKKTTAKKSETKKTPTAKKSTTVKKDAEKAPSPPAGRAIGGGSGRGSSAG
jgi:polyhydroxyalkanoate synthesis regulator phasin